MRNEEDLVFDLVEDARARVIYLSNATSEEIRDWKLKKAFQILSEDRAKETCPKDLYGWTPTDEPSRCEQCCESHQVRNITPVQCWQEWAFSEVEKDILRSQKIALQGLGFDNNLD